MYVFVYCFLFLLCRAAVVRQKRSQVAGSVRTDFGLAFRSSAPERYQSGTHDRGGWCMYAPANLERLVLGCMNVDFCNQDYQVLFFSIINCFEI